MRPRRLFVVLACAISSCRGSTAPDLESLVGEWADAPHLNRDGSSYQQLLTFRADGTFANEFRTYAASPASVPPDLTAYTRAEGTFGVRNDSLFEYPILLKTWDRSFNGGKESVSQVDYGSPRPGQPDTSGAHYEVSAGMLRLHYLTFPADAAVETETTYFRVP